MNEHLSNWGEPLMYWLLAWCLVNLLVAASVLFLRPRRASVRYAGWLLATFSGVILIPFAWGLTPVVSWEQMSGIFQKTEATRTSPGLKKFEYWMSPSDQEIAELTPTLIEKKASPAIPGSAEILSGGSTEEYSSKYTDNNASSIWIIKLIASVWFAGFIFCLVRLSRTFVDLCQMVSESRGPAPELHSQFEAVQRALKIRRKIPLLVHPSNSTPICLGGFRPTILWPAPENEQMSHRQRSAVLMHELGHLGRYDDRINLAAEIWRAFCWFFFPVHWSISRLRREQEYLCDDLAASHFERPGEYAQMLINLSPVRIRDKSLCISFIGSSMKHRIHRLLRTDLRSLAPINCMQMVALMLVAALILLGAGSVRLVGNVNRSVAAEPNDSPLPDVTPRQMAEKVGESFNTYQKGYLEATYEDERDTNAFAAGEDKQPVMVKFPGRFRYASNGYLWRAEFEGRSYNSGETKLTPRNWSAGFDGERHYAWRQPFGGFVLGEWQPHEGIPLQEFFWSSHGESFSKSLTEKDWIIARQENLGGFRCYVLTREATYDTYKARYELTLSPRQSHLPVRYKVFANGKLNWSYELLDLEKTKNGVWFPRRVRRISSSMKRKYIAKIIRFESDGIFADGYFDVKIPLGVHVHDYRTGRIYLNDPWWPEVKTLMSLFDWPPRDLTHLKSMGSYADPAIEGKPAPPLSVENWINGKPVTLKQRQGKVTLLYFSTNSLITPNVRWASSLKGLYETYKPFGFEIIGLNIHTKEIDQVVQNLEEIQIPWPVAVDTAEQGSLYGKTFKSYGVKSYISPFLIDHQGKVHLIKSGEIADDVRRLLQDAGAKNVPNVSLDFVQAPKDLSKTLNINWHDWVRSAPQNALIKGKVTDADGPLANVKIEGRLRLETAGSAHTVSATSIYNFNDFKFLSTTSKDGSFELKNLCRGIYLLKFNLPGRKEVEHRVIVPAGPRTVPLDVKLDSK